MRITKPQLARLQTLYSQWEKHSLSCPGASREDRLRWASAQTSRAIASFSELDIDEGKRLIDQLQDSVGRKFPAAKRRRAMPTRASRQQGTAGRHDQAGAETVMAGANDLALIQRDMDELGWDQARLEAFLRSRSSPLRGRFQVRTLADANKLHWALKKIAKAQKTPLAS